MKHGIKKLPTKWANLADGRGGVGDVLYMEFEEQKVSFDSVVRGETRSQY